MSKSERKKKKEPLMEGEGWLLIVTYPDMLFHNGLSHQLNQFQLGQLFLWAQLVSTWPRQVVTPKGPGLPP